MFAVLHDNITCCMTDCPECGDPLHYPSRLSDAIRHDLLPGWKQSAQAWHMTGPHQQMSNHWEGTSCPPTAPPRHQSLLNLMHKAHHKNNAHNMDMLFCILTDPRCDIARGPNMTSLTTAVRTLHAYGKYDGTNMAVGL